jgi:hypothetical protein
VHGLLPFFLHATATIIVEHKQHEPQTVLRARTEAQAHMLAGDYLI